MHTSDWTPRCFDQVAHLLSLKSGLNDSTKGYDSYRVTRLLWFLYYSYDVMWVMWACRGSCCGSIMFYLGRHDLQGCQGCQGLPGKGQHQDAGFGSRNESKWPQTWVLVSVLLGSLKTWILLGAGWHYRYYRQPFFPDWVDILQGPDDFKGASLAARVVSIMNREVWFLWLSSRFQILKSSLSWQSCMAVSLHSLSTFRQRRDSRDIVFPPAPCRPGKGFPAKGMPGKGFPMHKGALPKGTGKGLASGCWMLCHLIAFGPCN